MATYTYPTQMSRGGEVATARNAKQFYNLLWAGWTPTSAPVPVDSTDSFSDEAVAALVANMSSETFAALASVVVTKLQLAIQPTEPTPLPGRVWIKNIA